jgi:mannose-6-phosphate isomerase-like protein (cupin superfamily)
MGNDVVNSTLLDRADLLRYGNTDEYEGFQYDTNVSFIWVDMPPGGAIRLNKHPYQEIFIIQEGVATFTIGTAILEARAGQIICVPANVPHKLMNLSDRQLKQVDLYLNKQLVTDWLED